MCSLSLPLPKDLPTRGSFRPQLKNINLNYRRQSPKQAENTTVLSQSRETLCRWRLSSYGWQESGGKLSRNHQLQEEDQVLPFKSPTGGRAGSPSPHLWGSACKFLARPSPAWPQISPPRNGQQPFQMSFQVTNRLLDPKQAAGVIRGNKPHTNVLFKPLHR